MPLLVMPGHELGHAYEARALGFVRTPQSRPGISARIEACKDAGELDHGASSNGASTKRQQVDGEVHYALADPWKGSRERDVHC